MDTYQAICTRRTIRLYQQKEISSEILERILNAGRVAPSGANRQPLEFILVKDDENRAKLFEQLAWAAYVQPRRNPPQDKRPIAYIIVLIKSKLQVSGVADAAAAIENMILTAWNEGIGSCWIGSVNRENVRKLFNIPDEYQINDVLALGYPAESPVMEEIQDSNNENAHKYWLDENDVLHVPKRRLSEIVHYEKF